MFMALSEEPERYRKMWRGAIDVPSGLKLGRTMTELCVLAALVAFLMSGWVANRFIFYPMRYPEGDWELQRSRS